MLHYFNPKYLLQDFVYFNIQGKELQYYSKCFHESYYSLCFHFHRSINSHFCVCVCVNIEAAYKLRMESVICSSKVKWVRLGGFNAELELR